MTYVVQQADVSLPKTRQAAAEAMGGVMRVEIVVPGVPDSRARPNDHSVSERTRIRWRRQFAADAVMPIRQARIDGEATFPVEGLVTLDLLFRWPKGRKTQDRDSLITQCKYLVDHLERERLIVNDRDVRYRHIEQETTTGQPEVVMVVEQL